MKKLYLPASWGSEAVISCNFNTDTGSIPRYMWKLKLRPIPSQGSTQKSSDSTWSKIGHRRTCNKKPMTPKWLMRRSFDCCIWVIHCPILPWSWCIDIYVWVLQCLAHGMRQWPKWIFSTRFAASNLIASLACNATMLRFNTLRQKFDLKSPNWKYPAPNQHAKKAQNPAKRRKTPQKGANRDFCLAAFLLFAVLMCNLLQFGTYSSKIGLISLHPPS